MLRANFGIEKEPFAIENCTLLPLQQEIYDVLLTQSHHGRMSLLLGEPGTGKSVIKEHIIREADRRKSLVATIGRTLHTYNNTTRLLCQAFEVDTRGTNFKCEKNLIAIARALHSKGMTLITIIDDAHLLHMEHLRKLRLLFAEFPHNHNLILIGQPEMMVQIKLGINDDIRSRITYSETLQKMTMEHIEEFILLQLDACGLGHNIFEDGSLDLICRNAEGILRLARNLCLSCLFTATYQKKQRISTGIVNRVLQQPHWRKSINI